MPLDSPRAEWLTAVLCCHFCLLLACGCLSPRLLGVLSIITLQITLHTYRFLLEGLELRSLAWPFIRPLATSLALPYITLPLLPTLVYCSGGLLARQRLSSFSCLCVSCSLRIVCRAAGVQTESSFAAKPHSGICIASLRTAVLSVSRRTPLGRPGRPRLGVVWAGGLSITGSTPITKEGEGIHIRGKRVMATATMLALGSLLLLDRTYGPSTTNTD